MKEVHFDLHKQHRGWVCAAVLENHLQSAKLIYMAEASEKCLILFCKEVSGEVEKES